MPFSNFFFYIGNINIVFRSFILGTVFSAYALSLYYFDLGIKIEMSDLSYLFAVPFLISTIVLLIIPKKFSKNVSITNSKNTKQSNQYDVVKVQPNISKFGSSIISNELNGINKKTSEAVIQKKSVNYKTNTEIDNQRENSNQVEEKLSKQLENVGKSMSDYDKKISEFEKQLQDMRVTMQDLKRTGVIKNDTYESALTELKAFKSELDNPFNFINKYFEMLDIPGMYDPKSKTKQNELQPQIMQQDVSKSNIDKTDSQFKNKKSTKSIGKDSNQIEKHYENEELTSINKISAQIPHKKYNSEKTIFRAKKVDIIG